MAKSRKKFTTADIEAIRIVTGPFEGGSHTSTCYILAGRKWYRDDRTPVGPPPTIDEYNQEAIIHEFIECPELFEPMAGKPPEDTSASQSLPE